PEDERLYLLLDRYLAGEAWASEAEAVQRWLATDAAHALPLDDLRVIKRAIADKAPHSSTDAAWAKVVKALAIAAQTRLARRLLVAALAAAAVIVALIGGLGVLRRTPQWRGYATTAAQRRVVRLPDGPPATPAPTTPVRYLPDSAPHPHLSLAGAAPLPVAR